MANEAKHSVEQQEKVGRISSVATQLFCFSGPSQLQS